MDLVIVLIFCHLKRTWGLIRSVEVSHYLLCQRKGLDIRERKGPSAGMGLLCRMKIYSIYSYLHMCLNRKESKQLSVDSAWRNQYSSNKQR